MEKTKRGDNAVLTTHIGKKEKKFDSPLLNDEKWILPLCVLSGLKDDSHIVDTYSLAQHFMREEIDELYGELDEELRRYAAYAAQDTSEKFLSVLSTGMAYFDNPEILESFYEEELLNKYAINEFDIAKYLFHGWEGRNWYQRTLKAFKDELRGYDIDLFVKLFAITSPMTHFKANLTNAFRAYELFQKKKKFEKQEFLPNVTCMLNDFRSGTLTFTGEERNGRRKISNFARAILGDKHAVVIDSWVLEALGLSETYLYKGKEKQHTPRITEYDLAETYVSLLAETTGYQPRQIIAMLWSGMKRQHARFKETDTSSLLKEVLHRQKSSFSK